MVPIRYLTRIILLILLFTVSLMGQQGNNEYKFPIKPGMPEWKSLKTHSEMLKALSLPDNIKQTISTDALAKTCLNYPLFIDIYAYDNIKSGFMQLRKDFNGFDELLSRKDAFTELLKLYDKMEPDHIIEKNSLLEKGRFTTDFCKIEIIMTQPEILNNMSIDKKHAMLKAIYAKHNKMLKHPEFDIRSIESNAYLMGKILSEINSDTKARIEQNKKTNMFVKTSKFLDKDVILEIISIAQSFLNK